MYEEWLVAGTSMRWLVIMALTFIARPRSGLNATDALRPQTELERYGVTYGTRAPTKKTKITILKCSVLNNLFSGIIAFAIHKNHVANMSKRIIKQIVFC